jgi:hypothetical protein
MYRCYAESQSIVVPRLRRMQRLLRKHHKESEVAAELEVGLLLPPERTKLKKITVPNQSELNC